MIFSGGGSFPSSLSIEASSPCNEKVLPNESMQQAQITRVSEFIMADCREWRRETKEKILAGSFVN
jgi:hypothetical protein